ncbi:hypothetical protein BD769DRAFT_1631409 [Suillus cothurnatus]|nr:hypothetical protein BD769DRAFT_1631409 [Suillus cothurnatus]
MLLCHGLLGCSPIQPTVAICLECLELYHQIRQRQSSFSIQSITRVLCALHNSNYFITNDIVEQFRDDVSNCPGQRKTFPNPSCTDNWTTAKSHKEDKISVFEQTGIFLMACHHGFVECIIEMKCSGELAKYGLAAINWMLDICGKDQALGYDIGCSSRKTVAASSIAAKAHANNLVIAVNAFHGYAHNCQCRFSHNNYIQALSMINDFTPLLDDFKLCKSLTDEDFIQWKHEESEFLANLSHESPADVFAVTYVEEMEKLQFLEAKYGSIMSIPFLVYTPANFTASSGLNVSMWEHSKVTEAEQTSALQRLQLQMNIVKDFEHHHGIDERWMPSDPRYVEALKYYGQQHFIRVVKELEGLAVQRLIELSKVNLSGTGYKMCKYISKAITQQSSAIHTALNRYNKLAPLHVPPRPILDYAEVIGPWAIPENRKMAAKFFKVLCSHEEITRLNVEIGRLHAWMEFEEKSMISTIAALKCEGSPLLAFELQRQYAA